MRQRGFTLLELLVVLGIAVLAVATVGVRSDAWAQRAAYHQAVRDVAALLRAGRSAALQQGRDVNVRYDPQTAVLSFGHGPRQRVVLPTGLDVHADGLVAGPGAAHVSAVPPLFVFRPDGSAYGGQLTIKRGATGVVFSLNWALGSVEQTAVATPPS